MSNYQNFSFSSFLISLDAPTQTSICHSLSYQQINKSKQASKKQTHFLITSLSYITKPPQTDTF